MKKNTSTVLRILHHHVHVTPISAPVSPDKKDQVCNLHLLLLLVFSSKFLFNNDR